jgi:elongation factor P
MGQAGDIRNGKQLEVDGVLYKCIEFQHTKTARQAGMIRTKLKNLLTGATIEKTFRLTDTYNDATLDKVDMSFSYVDGMDHVFMNMDTYEEARVPSSNLENFDYIKEGTIVEVVWWNDKAIEVNIPKKVMLTVSDGVSNTGAGKKEVTVETGARVKDVPEYIQTGDEIWVNTDTGKFVERVK